MDERERAKRYKDDLSRMGMALGYTAGRRDAGDRDVLDSTAFAISWVTHCRLFDDGKVATMLTIGDFYASLKAGDKPLHEIGGVRVRGERS